MRYENIPCDMAISLIKQGNIEIVDVRTKEEYINGHIPNSRLIPVQEIDKRYTELDRSKTLLMVCRSGNCSGMASEILANRGFSKVYNLMGGMNQWKGEIEK